MRYPPFIDFALLAPVSIVIIFSCIWPVGILNLPFLFDPIGSVQAICLFPCSQLVIAAPSDVHPTND